ncbi:MAG: CRISPR-associated protein Cas4 [Deltaproteobacteria bacterium]|nr:CRISPR-associated protein Cas4 [Deltaproteobacteria bacterium]
MEQDQIIYSEDDLLPLSGLQHIIFCKRQAALIHIEQAWAENMLAAEGRVMHDKVHEGGSESRGDVRVEYAMPLRSLRLGLIAKADVVEFHRVNNQGESQVLKWQPFPVEYKHGKPKKDNSDKVQLCGQAICLEEMLNVRIVQGALFYGAIRRREDVIFDDELRQFTQGVAREFHELIAGGITPKAVYSKRCDNCSMYELCLPKTVGKSRKITNYLKDMVIEK